MAIWEHRDATAAKPGRIEDDPRLAVLAELRIGIEAAHKAINHAERAEQQAAASDAYLAYTKAIMLLTQTQAAMRNAIVQEQFAHLELLLRRIGLPAE
jgi:hypothetical protein